MIGKFATNFLRKFRPVEIDFVTAMVHYHLVNNFILSKTFLMRSDWLECSAKHFASIRFKIKTIQCAHPQLSCLQRIRRLFRLVKIRPKGLQRIASILTCI